MYLKYLRAVQSGIIAMVVLVQLHPVASLAEQKPNRAKKSVERKLTDKEAAELNSYKKRQALIEPLADIPGAPNRFDKETLYVMKNFNILQKIKSGYLITANAVVWRSGNSLDFGVAFLRTSKSLPEDVLITGAVVYDGQYEYLAKNGYKKKIPRLKIPANLPISGIRKDGDPFAAEYF